MSRSQVHLRLSDPERRRMDRVKELIGLPGTSDAEAIRTAVFWYWLAREASLFRDITRSRDSRSAS